MESRSNCFLAISKILTVNFEINSFSFYLFENFCFPVTNLCLDKLKLGLKLKDFPAMLHEIKTKEKIVCEISEILVRILKNEEIPARILNKERNLCTNFINKPTKLHQDRHPNPDIIF